MLRLAMLISGSGSTLRNLLERIADGRLPGVQMAGVMASRECGGLEHARHFGVPHAIVPRSLAGGEFDVDDFSARVTAALDQWQPGLLAFGGFLSRYVIPPHYHGRAINIHPALLPAHGGAGMYGDRVHAAVLASGVAVSGCSVHFVTDEYDAGPVITRAEVPVLPGDTPETLGARVREAERELYPRVIGWFAQGRVRLNAEGSVNLSVAP